MNTSDTSDWPKQTFLKKGKDTFERTRLWFYTHAPSHNFILTKLRRITKRCELSLDQEKRLQHFISFIDGPENTDILENLCHMKTSKKHDICWLLACLEQAEKDEKIGPQFIMDTILVFYHSPRKSILSRAEKAAVNKLKNILVKRVPKVEKILPENTKI